MTIPEVISWLNDAAPAINRLGLPSFSWEAEALHEVFRGVVFFTWGRRLGFAIGSGVGLKI
jgi:hypothetical protein